jgi:hypothetical protein
MKRFILRFPGPMPVKIILFVAIVVVALVGLFFFYDWIGTSLLDTGGTIS